MLTTEERQSMRKLSESISALLSSEKLEHIGQAAHRLIDNLRELLGSDETAAKVASMLAEYCASLEFVPVGVISTTLDSTGSAYALAAGSLAGVYTLPERKDGAELDGNQCVVHGHGTQPPASDNDDQAWPGQYL